MTDRIPGRPAKKKVGTASKILVTGAAFGGSLALVGAMTAAAQAGTAEQAAPIVVRQVVVEPAPTPEPIVIIVQTSPAAGSNSPGSDSPAASAPLQAAPNATQAQAPTLAPEPEPAPAPAPAPAPQAAAPATESGGS